jgi:hypothetical protein
MRRRAFVSFLTVGLFAVLISGSVGSTAGQQASAPAPQLSGAVRSTLDAQRGKAPARLPNGLFVPAVSGGVENTVLKALGPRAASAGRAARQLSAADFLPDATLGTYGCRNVFTREGRPRNVRANVDCGFRFQSEEWVSINPTDPRNIVVSQNDSKLQGNRTGVNFSLNRARNFGDSVLPTGRVLIDAAPGGEWSFDAFSDPASDFDSRGNFYYTAIAFDFAADAFGGVFVWKSNSCLKGTALHTPGSGSCDPFDPPLSGTAIPVRTNFDNPALSDDKEFMAVDSFPNSPFRDNVYITWTIFDFSCPVEEGGYCESPIFFSRSEDGGVTWSEPLEISGVSPELCNFGDIFNPTENPNACNFSQGSFPLVGPDGTIYVIYNNFNTSPEAAVIDGVAQFLLVKSTDGGNTWTDPVKVGDDFETYPHSIPGHEIPSCPPFRPCLPPNGYRLFSSPSLGIDENTGRLAAFWHDFRNGGPCAVDTATLGVPVPVAPCENHNNDVFAAISTDGGDTWGPTRKVSDGGLSAQWQAWGDVGENGKLYVAYYDRKYGNCEQTGCNDITLATSRAGVNWSHRRITTSSMPNLTCENNSEQCGFLGDYMSTRFFRGTVHMVWGDTRGRGVGSVPEEDIYYARVGG